MQYEIFANPGQLRQAVPFLLAIQNDHIVGYTGAVVVIPLRADIAPVTVMAPLVEVPGHGQHVLSAAEIFTIDRTRLKTSVASLGMPDRAKIRPALDKVIGEY
mgnify:CR=1 FL=1